MEKVFLRSVHNYDTDVVSLETGLVNDGEGEADQSFRDECDINTIVRRFGLTGEIPAGVEVPTYRDFDRVYDYHSAMLELRRAEVAFGRLPADVRARFSNDPGKLVAFMDDEANRSEAEKLGLVRANAPAEGAVGPVASSGEPSGSPGSSKPSAPVVGAPAP